MEQEKILFGLLYLAVLGYMNNKFEEIKGLAYDRIETEENH